MITSYGATEGVDESNPPVRPEQSQLPPEKLAALQRLIEKRDQLDPEHRALIETMAEQYKIPMSPKQGFTQKPNPQREQMGALGEAAKVSALPLAGQALGGAFGTMFGGVPGGIAGQSVGGVMGLMGNKALGISTPDALDVALSGSAPLLAKGMTAGGRRAIPGGAAAEQQIGAEMLRDVPKSLPGSKDATTAAYDKVEALGSPNMPVPNLTKAVGELADTEKVAKKYGGANAVIGRAVLSAGKTLQTQNGTMPFRDVSVMLKRYRQKTADLEGKGGEVWGAYKDLRKALFDDMAQAEKAGGAAGDSVQAQREAMSAAKQQIAKDEFTETIEKHGTKMATVDGQTFEVIDPTKVLNKLKDMGFEQSVGKQQYQQIEKTLKQLASIPKPSSATGTGVGTPMRATAMAGAGILGSVIGSGATGGIVGAAGAAGAIAVHDAIASLMMSEKGRNFLVRQFKASKGRISDKTAGIMQFAADQLQSAPE